ncbi:50S ribosomal protein L29 [bacterium F16]|nr:50S ribosomal protein L29 [bacterium F16]
MKYTEIKELTEEELVKQLQESRHELLNLRIQQANGSIENPSRVKQVRRDIARLKTETTARKSKETAQ